jgi:hypothetical protein
MNPHILSRTEEWPRQWQHSSQTDWPPSSICRLSSFRQAVPLRNVDRFPNQGNSDNARDEDAAYDHQEQEDHAYAKFDPY